MFIQIKYYFASNLRFPGSSHVGLSTKNKNKLVCDVGYSILLPHMTGLFVVTSLIQTVHKTKSTHGGVFAYFKRHKTNNCNAKKRLKNKNNYFLAKKTRNHEKKKKKKKTNAFQIPYL